MATISTAATGGSEFVENVTVTYASQPNDWYIGFTFSKGGVNTSSGWTRFAVNNLASIGWGSGFYFNDTTGVGSVSFTSGLSSGFLSYVILRIRPDADKRIVLRATNQSTASTSTPSLAVPGELNSQSIIVGGHSVADNVYFSDTDTTNGSWTSVVAQTSTGVDRAVATQAKIVTGSSAQNYGGTMVSSETLLIMTLNLSEVNFGYWGVRA